MKVNLLLPQRLFCVLAVALAFSGCGPGTGTSAANMIMNTAIAASASGVRRSRGECYTPCDHETICNPENGLCEPLPCFDRCSTNERCVGTGRSARCIPSALSSNNDSKVVEEEQRPMAMERWEEEERELNSW